MESVLSEVAKPTLVRFEALLDGLCAEADARYEARRTGKPMAPVTGLTRLDEYLGDGLAPGLHILHGSPGVGKTAFALQSSALCSYPALYVTTEMTPLELFRRHTSRVTGTYLGRLKSGDLTGEKVRDLALRAMREAPLMALLDATETPAPIADVLRAAEVVRGEASRLLVVVDSLHSWADGIESGEEYERLNTALAHLRLLSKRLDSPILVIAERNRSSMRSGGQSAGAGTRKIEYGAESVLELDAKEESFDASGEIAVTLTISKNRNGTTGKVGLRFCGRLQSYREES